VRGALVGENVDKTMQRQMRDITRPQGDAARIINPDIDRLDPLSSCTFSSTATWHWGYFDFKSKIKLIKARALGQLCFGFPKPFDGYAITDYKKVRNDCDCQVHGKLQGFVLTREG
jgi:hypothetical protein